VSELGEVGGQSKDKDETDEIARLWPCQWTIHRIPHGALLNRVK